MSPKIGWFVFGLMLLVGCGKSPSPVPADGSGTAEATEGARGMPSPELAFEAFRDAAANDDVEAALDLLTEDSLSTMAGGMIFATSFMAAFQPEMANEIEAILKKHGYETGGSESDNGGASTLASMGGEIRDKRAFIVELSEYVANHNDSEGGIIQVFRNAQLGEVVVEGDSASASVITPDGDEPIEFRRVAGKWLIKIPEEELTSPTGSSPRMEFGDASGFDDFEFGIEESDPLPPVDAVTQDAFSEWKTALDVGEKPAGEVLVELAELCGMQISNVDEFSDRLKDPVAIKLAEVSTLRAIESVCEQVGLYPKYRLRKIVLAEGPRKYPVTFAGPFRVEVIGVEEFVPYAVGQVDLRFVACGIPVSAIARLKELTGWSYSGERDDFAMKLTDAKGSGGKNLLGPAADQPQADSKATTKVLIFDRSVRIKNLLRSVTQVERLAGEVRFSLPSKIDKLKFDEVAEGATVKEGGVELTLGRLIVEDENSVVPLKYKGTQSDQLTLVATDAQGNLIEANGSGGFNSGDGGELSTFLSGRPDAIEVRIIREKTDFDFAFELPPIDLRSFSQMPEKVQPLTYEGDTPVTIKFDSVSGTGQSKKINLEVTNLSNRDIQGVAMHLDYFDAAGNKLDDSPHTHGGSRDMVPASETIKLSVSAFFMPEAAKTCEVHATRVWFADASEWASE